MIVSGHRFHGPCSGYPATAKRFATGAKSFATGQSHDQPAREAASLGYPMRAGAAKGRGQDLTTVAYLTAVKS